MPDYVHVLLNFMTQFAGGRGGIDHNVVQFGLAATIWGTLLIYARDRQQEDNPDRERLLVLGFSLGLARELFMFGLAFIVALGWVNHDLMHIIFPPLEHTLINAAMFVVAGAFLLFLLHDRDLARRYLRWSLSSLALCYLATFSWWGAYIVANPASKFSQTWCNWALHLNSSFWLLLALIVVLRSARSTLRNLISVALFLFFTTEFLKIPDMALSEVYEANFTPIRHSCYLFGVFLLAFIYLREQAIERKQANKQVLRLAHYDTLTGLPNRALFHDRLKQTMALAERSKNRFALLFLDLDRFKAINDSYGHTCGDELLKAVSSRLSSCLRMGDTLARLGGDEFVVLLPNIDSTNAAVTVADKILDEMQQEFQLKEQQIFTSTSIGLAFYPDNGEDIESLLKHADLEMYAAKDEGRYCYHLFSAEMHREIVYRHKVAEELRLAIQQEDFILHYQPQIDIATERIVGAEALIRWQHPKRGLIPPGQFIPIAEETGLILAIGEWVFRNACKQFKVWLDQGLGEFKLSINLSAHRLEQTDFLEVVEMILLENEITPQHIELELTETSMLANTDKATTLLNHLKLRGFTLAMDDFGTGYSSLSYLKRLPFDQVKIDQSFIKGINLNDGDTLLVKTILSMADHLNLSVVAEGVETYEQYAYLKEHGCGRAQGFYFSRPVPADEFAERLFASQFNSELNSA